MNFESFLHDAGLLPREIIPGRWLRCRTVTHKNPSAGSYKLAEDGLIGWCENYSLGTGTLTWRPDGPTVPRADYGQIAKRRAEERRALLSAISGAREFYESCRLVRVGHPYLESHGLSMAGCSGLKVDAGGWLVIPVRLQGLISVQRISPDGEKRFWPGAPVRGGFFTVARPRASITVLCEGLATGLAIFAAAPLTQIVVAFNAGNLPRVATGHRGLVVVASDNDHGTEVRLGRNPGLDAAREAAETIGCGVAVPTEIVGTDWCDYRTEKLTGRLARRVRGRESELRRAVDAEIASAMARNARFVTVRSRAAEAV